MKGKFKRWLLNVYSTSRVFGIDPVLFFRSIGRLPAFYKDLFNIRKQKGSDRAFPFGRMYPILTEGSSEAGVMSGHYFHQDLFVASRIFINKPERHIDIGSRTDGFVAHVAVFRKIEIIDIRKQISTVKNIVFTQADLMMLPAELINSCDSISSLHAIEHFGLGRYGDPIDYNGHFKAIENITKMLKPGGCFYFSVPIGEQRIEFNAQRVFSVKYLIDLFENNFILKQFSFVDDKGDFHENVKVEEPSISQNFGCYYGCGIFELKKKATV